MDNEMDFSDNSEAESEPRLRRSSRRGKKPSRFTDLLEPLAKRRKAARKAARQRRDGVRSSFKMTLKKMRKENEEDLKLKILFACLQDVRNACNEEDREFL